MSGGQVLKQPCDKKCSDKKTTSKCPKPKELDAKKATIIRMRKYARETKEDREVTRAKIKAIREHDMSTGRSIQVRVKDMIYVFSIRK